MARYLPVRSFGVGREKAAESAPAPVEDRGLRLLFLSGAFQSEAINSEQGDADWDKLRNG